MHQAPPPRSVAAQPPRRAWQPPKVARLPLSETRNGIDPIVEDGAFSFGS